MHEPLLNGIKAVEKGGEPPMVLRNGDGAGMTGPVGIDTIGPAEGWQDTWRAHERERREASAWAQADW